VNLRGQYSIAPGTPRLVALFERHRGRVRVMGRTLLLREDGMPREDVVKAYDNTLLRYGFRIDANNCFSIPWQPDEQDWLSRAANRLAREPASHDGVLSLASCALRPAVRSPRDIEAERRISALIEASCPRVFRGQKALTDPLGNEWSRHYAGLDARLETHGDRVILNRYLALSYFDFGPLSAWERGEPVLPPQCKGR
jgi:hypothetical protein